MRAWVAVVAVAVLGLGACSEGGTASTESATVAVPSTGAVEPADWAIVREVNAEVAETIASIKLRGNMDATDSSHLVDHHNDLMEAAIALRDDEELGGLASDLQSATIGLAMDFENYEDRVPGSFQELGFASADVAERCGQAAILTQREDEPE